MAPRGHTLSPAKSPPGTECFDIFSPPPGDSEVISQLERLNSNETKLAPRSVWIAVNGSDLSARMFMVSSKMDGSDPHFDAESIATHNTSWDLETHLPYPLQHSCPAHSPPPFRAVLKPDRSRATKTGQITSQPHQNLKG